MTLDKLVETINVVKAGPEHINGIKALVDLYAFGSTSNGRLLQLEESQIAEVVSNGGFHVALDGDNVIACSSVVEYGLNHGYGENIAELRTVATMSIFHGRGIGDLVVMESIREAEARGHDQLYLLTKPDMVEYFGRFGFIKTGVPLEKRAQNCSQCPYYESGCDEVAMVRNRKMENLLSMMDMDNYSISKIMNLAAELRQHPREFKDALPGNVLGIIMMKPSLRTRLSLELGMKGVGGEVAVFDYSQSRGARLYDEASVLARYSDILAARVFSHTDDLGDITKAASGKGIPVINALSDRHHPLQALADLFTINEKAGFSGVKVAYIGDGNNVCNDLVIACSKMGIEIAVATPPGYEPKHISREGDVPRKVLLTNDPLEAARNADFVYTDTWISMGQDAEADARRAIFTPYQVTRGLLGKAFFMHCMPMHRGEEVTDEVAESPKSIIFDQAENRLYTAQAVLLTMFGKVQK